MSEGDVEGAAILSGRFSEALVFAARLHAAQVRKGSRTPYVAHLLSVAGIALEYGADEDEAIAALLHDAVEDQGGEATLEVLRRCFGERVAAIVEGCTDAYTHPKPPWKPRKQAYLAHLQEADASVRLVCAADKLHNARSILNDLRDPAVGEHVWQRFNASREDTLWYYRELVAALRSHGASTLVEELARTVAEIERLSRSEDEDGPTL